MAAMGSSAERMLLEMEDWRDFVRSLLADPIWRRRAIAGASSLPPQILADPSVVELIAGESQVEPCPLQFASLECRSMRHIVQIAVRSHGCALEWAGDHLKDERELVLEAIGTSGGNALEHASPRLRDDFQVVLRAVSEFGMVLADASPAMRNNKVICLAAVRNCGLALKDCGLAITSDPEVVLAAVQAGQSLRPSLRPGPWALRYAGPSLLHDSNFLRVVFSLECWRQFPHQDQDELLRQLGWAPHTPCRAA